jgi:hypothetical protein
VLQGAVRQVSVRAVQDSFLFAMSGETMIATLNKFAGAARSWSQLCALQRILQPTPSGVIPSAVV